MYCTYFARYAELKFTSKLIVCALIHKIISQLWNERTESENNNQEFIQDLIQHSLELMEMLQLTSVDFGLYTCNYFL